MTFKPEASMPVTDLRSHEHYIASCVTWAQEKLQGFSSLDEIAAQEHRINRYPRLESLTEPHQVYILEDDAKTGHRLAQAKAAVARGEILFEHAAAGEGTRLMLGSKYFLNISLDFSLSRIAQLVSADNNAPVTPKSITAQLPCQPQELLPLSLGARHMLQLAFDLVGLARELGESPRELLARQHLLVILGEDMALAVEQDFAQWHFYGFNPAQVYFMVQKSFHGLNLECGRFFYDARTPRRLHNHGQMVMQQTMDRELFTLMGEKTHHKHEAVADWLQSFSDKISYNIEDLDYLSESLDFPGLGLVLELRDQGYHMVMEVVANNPRQPQKGGMLAWDPEMGRDVMIESFQLGDLPNASIRYLNRNFNHYPQPWVSWQRIREEGLPMPFAVKGGFLYFQPVQGDINFLVPTAFFRRRELRPIRNLKRPNGLPLAIQRMAAQDCQPGFREFVQQVQQGSL